MDSVTTTNKMADLERLYAGVLELTAHARALLFEPAGLKSAHDEYRSLRFTTVPDVLPADLWEAVALQMLPLLSRVGEKVILLHKAESDSRLSDGACFHRIDPYCVHQPSIRAAMSLLLEQLGLSSFAALLALKLTPLVQEILGPARFVRSYFYIYEEDDYISAHNDYHVGDRVDVQFPVSISTFGGIRVLCDGLMRMRYDSPGAMNILGPRVWHEVPPLLRTSRQQDPRRFNMGLRFEPG